MRGAYHFGTIAFLGLHRTLDHQTHGKEVADSKEGADQGSDEDGATEPSEKEKYDKHYGGQNALSDDQI